VTVNSDETKLANLLDPPTGSPGLVKIDPRGIDTEIEDRLERAQSDLRARTHHAAATAFEILFTRRSRLSTEFARQFRKARQLERRYVEELNNVRQTREEAQYGLGRPEDESAERVMTQAHGFVQAIEEVLA
jgi:hypothetical protein